MIQISREECLSCAVAALPRECRDPETGWWLLKIDSVQEFATERTGRMQVIRWINNYTAWVWLVDTGEVDKVRFEVSPTI
jgi:hypothetical protein